MRVAFFLINQVGRQKFILSIFFGFLALFFGFRFVLWWNERRTLIPVEGLISMGLKLDWLVAFAMTAISSLALWFFPRDRGGILVVGFSLFVFGLNALFFLTDYGFYIFGGRHFYAHDWAYMDMNNIRYISKSIWEQFLDPRIFLVTWVTAAFFGLQARILWKVKESRERTWTFLTLFILLLFTLPINVLANRARATVGDHKSGLARNLIHHQWTTLWDVQAPIVVSPEELKNVQSWVTLGNQEKSLNLEYPFAKQFTSHTALSKPKNLIWIVLESFGGLSTTGWSPYFHEVTPKIAAWAKKGVKLNRLFITAAPSAPAFGSAICSFYDAIVVMREKPDLNVQCGPKILRDRGYDTAYMVGTGINFDNQGRFMRQQGVQEIFGDRDFFFPPKPARPGHFGNYNDEELFEQGLQWLGRRTSTAPYFLTLVTVTNHDPFPDMGPQYQSHEGTGKRQRAHSTMRYVDEQVSRFLSAIEKRDDFKDTVIVVFGDHPPAFQQSDFPVEEYPFQQAWIPGFILNPVGLKPGDQVELPISHVDLLPTSLDMLGVSYTAATAGHSLLDQSIPVEKRFVWTGVSHLRSQLWIQNEWGLTEGDGGPGNFYRLSDFPRVEIFENPKLQIEMERKIKELRKVSRWALMAERLWTDSLALLAR